MPDQIAPAMRSLTKRLSETTPLGYAACEEIASRAEGDERLARLSIDTLLMSGRYISPDDILRVAARSDASPG